MKLLMLKGLPGSGKSTWAKQFVAQNPGWIRINKDSIREMFAAKWSGKVEKLVVFTRDAAAGIALLDGLNVVVDDTNFDPKHEQRLRKIATEFKADFEVKFFDTSLADCIKNDLDRPKSVGEKVIRKMWRQYLAPKAEQPLLDPMLPFAIICDLDGTLAIHNGRSPYDTAKCETDVLNPMIAGLVDRYRDKAKIILVSGRDAKFMPETVRWLEANNFDFWLLVMRPEGDRRSDDIVKQEIYERSIKGQYNVLFVLDDRNRVVDMWRRNGLTCLQVAEGDF